MLSKVLMGLTAAAGIALWIVFSMLLSAKEANGVLTQGIETARGVNERQALVAAELQKNHDNLLIQIEQERVKTKIATDALDVSEKGLVTAKVDFDQRIKDALEGMTDEELVCASEFVPAGLIDSLWDDAGASPDGPGDSLSRQTDSGTGATELVGGLSSDAAAASWQQLDLVRDIKTDEAKGFGAGYL